MNTKQWSDEMKTDLSFDDIAKDIIVNKKFLKLKQESHHGITRYMHSMRVAKHVYKISKKMNMDYVSATRAAILHDFFTNEEFGSNHGLIQGVVHPDIALTNALGEFDLNEKEQNAIAAHMFPLCMTLPRYKESWILTLVDKVVAIYEYASYKFNYTKLTGRVNTAISLSLIFAFNILTMGRK